MRKSLGFDHLVALGCLIAGSVYLWSSTLIIEGAFGDSLGPRAFPQILGSLLVILSIILLTKARPAADGDVAPMPALLAIGCTVALVAVFVILMPIVGFAVSMFVMTLGFLLALRETVRSSLVYSAILTAAFHVLFINVLGTPLPDTWLGGLF